jgi:hypothetical protein
MQNSYFKQSALGVLGFAFIAIGTYNSVVVNSDSFMDSQDVRFVKRLDELNGLTTSGRRLADNGEWIKLRNVPAQPVVQDQVTLAVAAPRFENKTAQQSAPVQQKEVPEAIAEAAIKESLSLELAEVFNAKKYAQAPKAGEFSGTLSTHEGVIESMTVGLPNGESVSISTAQMAGNVFVYEHEGQDYNGMMYQMDKTSYMVTLTDGPYEGTRLKFVGSAQEEENFGNNSAEVAENNATEQAQPEYAAVANDDGSQMQVGSFGNEPVQAEQAVEPTDVAQNNVPAPDGGYGFNFDNSSATF